jgi:hypothetical protein
MEEYQQDSDRFLPWTCELTHDRDLCRSFATVHFTLHKYCTSPDCRALIEVCTEREYLGKEISYIRVCVH